MKKHRLSAWLLPITIFVIGCAGHYGSNRNLPPRGDEASEVKADLDANDPTTYEKHHDDDVKLADADDNSKDRNLAEDVRQAIDTDDASKVTIVAENGVVTLRGTVPTSEEKQLLADRAQRVSGVKRVENKLEVSATR
jgi:osmotically-inducible protein OsmY